MKELIVFTNNGQTYHFSEVTNFRPTTTGFSFTYTGKATGVTREAVFNNTSTAGYALVDEEDKKVMKELKEIGKTFSDSRRL
ncbi:hypothetical protein GQS62_04595 [Pediococcus pentosaceus]|uniref:hypothetical protein n=1 Tax=Pediococcus pentosaceus TaxID=1255 RepID=UPI0013032281|nr:hypothetical protein [Pediococcus pentosaceus]QGZ70125.1 hypothetical protein GQS62_04595 [Pediococcus pentosaceus]